MLGSAESEWRGRGQGEQLLMIAKIVVLYLTVYSCDTGAVLFQSTRQMPDISVSGNRIEDCRTAGVDEAKTLTRRFKWKFPHVSANVVCRWELPSQRA